MNNYTKQLTIFFSILLFLTACENNPHELVHIYTKELFNYQYHSWIDEGLATMLGGSRGKSLDWH